MKLSEKGHFAPPPKLPVHAQTVAERLASWDGVQARTHWLLGDETQIDGADFYLGDDELGHLHLDGEAHVAVPKKLKAALVAAGLAQPFRWDAGFVTHRVRQAGDVSRAEFLYQLAYDARRGIAESALIARVQNAA